MDNPEGAIEGATGYIGGNALFVLYEDGFGWEYCALVGSQGKADQISRQFHGRGPLEDEAQNANIVHWGLRQHSPDRLAWDIHTSRIGIRTVKDLEGKACRQQRQKAYNNRDGMNDLINMPDQALHRNLDKIALSPGLDPLATVKTAIVCPPAIHGLDSRSELGLPGASGSGSGWWWSRATWGEEGYYLFKNGHVDWGEVQLAIPRAAYGEGPIESPDLDVLNFDQTA
ncbi:hypothetical protein BDV30DRAFT_227032 [Aspergillus minisclerotigenes]|uniref:Uncharacterized protein n=1 Tax=Aspergillus minisclerotigenes TaxID=656917 RepID=A0A5N6J3H4_9EURO|nr:hypothetical protein BDV30DRAFT_227032 [Aspergillus minisclerotigenes]